jgi:ABC-type multidrug transport system ATPase subunit
MSDETKSPLAARKKSVKGCAGTNRGSDANTPVIFAEDLCKRYPEIMAVDSLCLKVGRGEIYGFLGRNGAGKTTTIRMLLGLIRPTRGRVLLFGKDVSKDRRTAVSSVGSLVETATSYPTLTVRENLEIQRRLTGTGREAMEHAIAVLGLKEQVNRRAGRLSLGNKQRLALARAILHSPRLLILDEPANGLDPAGIVEIRRLLRRLADEQKITVFVSSHILGEINQLADRIGIIHRGRLVEEFDIRQAETKAQDRLEIRTSDPERAMILLRTNLGIDEIKLREDRGIEIGGAAVQPAVIARLLVEAGLELRALCPIREDLEARFMRLTGGEP